MFLSSKPCYLPQCSIIWTKPRKGHTIDLWPLPFSILLFPKMVHSPWVTSNVPVTKTLLNVLSFRPTDSEVPSLQGPRAPQTPSLVIVLLFFIINGAWEGSGMRVWHVLWTDVLCVCVGMFVCVCPLSIQTPSVWWPDTVWESVCRRRIHTQHKGPIMSPHSEKEKGGGRGDNRGLSISEGGMMVSLPLTSPSSLLPAHKQIRVNKNWPWRKFLWRKTGLLFKHFLLWIISC